MRKRARGVQIIIWSLIVALVFGSLPGIGITEKITSDWFKPEIAGAAEPITEENAEIAVSVLLDGVPLADGDTVAPGAELTAEISLTLRSAELSYGEYEYALPEAVQAAESDWAELPGGGRWKLADHRVLLSFDGMDPETVPESVRADIAFPFTLADSAELAFPGRTLSLNVAEPDDNTLVFQGEDYSVALYPSEAAQVPADAVLQVTERTDTDIYLPLAAEKLGVTEQEIPYFRLFDLSILSDGTVFEPSGPVRVELSLRAEGDQVVALHFPEQKQAAPETRGAKMSRRSAPALEIDVLDTAFSDSLVFFETDSFSLFAVAGITFEKTVLASDGHNYRITVTYRADAEIPEDAALAVSEIPEEHSENPDIPSLYESYVLRAEDALGLEAGSAPYVRLFDIGLVDAEGEKLSVAAPVSVRIELADREEAFSAQVIHFAGNREAAEVLDGVSVEAEEHVSVSFETSGFSVYAIVDAPEPINDLGQAVVNPDELAANCDNYDFYLSVTRSDRKTYYFTNSLNSKSAFITSTAGLGTGSPWLFEPAGGNTYRICTLIDENRKYIYNPSDNFAGLTDNADTAAIFEVTPAANKLFYLKLQGQDKWLVYSNGGTGIRFWTDHNDNGNSRVTIAYCSIFERDPYGLDGKSFGIAYQDNTANAAALSTGSQTVGNEQRLTGIDMVMRPDVLDHEGVLLVSADSDIQFWTFELISPDRFYLTTQVSGVKKYLTISGANVTLEDTPDPVNSVIKVKPGTGSNQKKWNFSVNGRSLNLPAKADQGFNGANNTNARTWMNLVEKSVLGDDDFQLYTAKKVSVSDTEMVQDGQTVILYTRVWNDAAKRYEFYAVDHSGALIRCYDVGDSIQWTGSLINTAEWTFTEGRNPDGTLSYYYNLQNTQYGEYLSPQFSQGEGAITSSTAPGLNLNGRRYGQNYTSIITWDDEQYSYSGLKVKDGRVVACALSESDDFYFAIVNPIPEDDLTEVSTLDNNRYGITMRMVDFNNPIVGGRDSVQSTFFNGDNNNAGLLSTDLKGNGYPETTALTGSVKPLADLYTGMSPVNHLFLTSIHNESGYFEYNSTQNFAHLNEDGNFTVYDQIGAIGNVDRPTRKHGQFMPYNTLTPGLHSTFTNQTTELKEELSDLDPRKGEKLYLIPQNEADYFFGMELSANFTQTPSGKDAWGHDIIFEFSGDDDFWLYVDGQLVLDLGGVHEAMAGSVNFRTGAVKGRGGTSTTLYDVFKQNFETQGYTAAQVSAKLDEIFTENENGQHIFKDYSEHSMKIFYMERGAGASNLHMRFNLAAVKPGSFVLSKKLSGTDNPDSNLIEFPYQIWYTTRSDGESTYHLLGENPGEAERVFYQDTVNRVRYEPSFTPVGSTQPYRHVFLLSPGQAAEVNMPEDVVNYYVVECGVNPDIFDEVYANEVPLTGTASAGNPSRKDYSTAADTLDHRKKVDFENHVSPGAMRTLTITKRLYDTNGVDHLHYPENSTLFDLRLYLGSENANPDSLPGAYQYPYLVRNKDGDYCRWDAAQQAFVSLGIQDYSVLSAYLETLSSAERENIVFITSPNGSISKIPADHAIEIRDVIVSTQYKVEERDNEIPRGFTRRESDGYTRVDTSHYHEQGDPYYSVMGASEDPEIEVRNQKGWGLTVEKVWTDKDFMASHDPVYIAVFLDDAVVDGTVRQLTAGDSEIYYFFNDLYDSDHQARQFGEFVIREVKIGKDNPTVVNGVVLDPGTVDPIAEGDTMLHGGTTVGGTYHDSFRYTVHYKVGESTGQNENVRTDVVTNSRPGIELYKTDWDGHPLSGAVFTLKDANGQDIAAESYTSGEDGLITIAYPPVGSYTLTEIGAPKDYVVIDSPLVLHLNENDKVTVTDIDERFYRVEESQTGMLVSILIKNRPTQFDVRKIDSETGQPLEGVHFALYLQVTDTEGHKRKDYLPIAGYEDLVTDAQGLLSEVSMALPKGTYYLTETETLEGYDLLDDICFTLGTDGTVTVDTEAYESWLTRSEAADGQVTYTLKVKNGVIHPDPVIVRVTGVKVLRGRDMEEGEFTFAMTPVSPAGEAIGTPVCTTSHAARAGEESLFDFNLTYTWQDVEQAVYHDANGNALFYYVVSELLPDSTDEETGFDSGRLIYFDQNQFLVVVRIHEDTLRHILVWERIVCPYDPAEGVPEEYRPPTRTVTASR